MLAKSRGLRVDNVTYDLEDSVTPANKAGARRALRAFLTQPRPAAVGEVAVRVNAVASGLALADLEEIVQAPGLDALVVPKVDSGADLSFVADVVRHLCPDRQSMAERPLRILALIESAKALTDLASICAATPLLDGLIFAAEDFALDLSLTRTPSLSEFLFARSSIATHARAFNLPSTIDLVCTSYKGEKGLQTLEEECLGGKGLGFNGKQCIHPNQVDVVQRAFSPGMDELKWAIRVAVANEKAERAGRGAWTLDGQMIDAPVVNKAKAAVTRAEKCGIDVETVKEKWKDQEPE